MLQFIIGRSGTGKTTEILKRATTQVKDGEKVIVMVPEQISFDTERLAIQELGGTGSINLSVLSYDRICENIFRTYGGIAGTTLTNTAKLIVMKIAISEIGDQLETYKNQWKRVDFISTMINTIDEFKRSGVTPSSLEQIQHQMQQGPLREKLSDITQVFRVYQGIIDQKYTDPLDNLGKALHLLNNNPDFFKDYHIYFDSFHFLTPQQQEIAKIMLTNCKSLTISLCCDSNKVMEQEENTTSADIFTLQKNLLRNLQQYAMKEGILCKKNIVLEENYRLTTPDFQCVEKLLSGTDVTEITASGNIFISHFQNKYEEMRFVASEITRLVRDQNYRYNQIAIVSRNLDDYQSVADIVAKQYDIPLFYDKKESVKTRPIISVILNALDCVRGNWRSESILQLSRNPILNIEIEHLSFLENYVYLWSINKHQWENPFTKSSLGLEQGDKEDVTLLILEQLRQQLMAPLITLKKQLENCTGKTFVTSIFTYLTSINYIDVLKSMYEEDHTALEENDNLYNQLINILDEFTLLLGDTGVTVNEIYQIFDMAVNFIELGKTPNYHDQTVIGSAHRIRLYNPKILFVLGLNEGIFPATYQPSGIFSKNEREQLASQKIEIVTTPIDMAVQERFYLYTTLTATGGKLYISHFHSSLTGDKQEPSIIINKLISVLPNHKLLEESLCPDNIVVDLFTAREQFAYHIGNNTVETVLEQLLTQQNDIFFVNSMKEISAENPAGNISSETAKKLLGSQLRLSPTAIECYYQCPYMYFAQRMLKLKKREKVEYNPLNSGNAIHYTLEHLVKCYESENLPASQNTAITKSFEKNSIDSLTDVELKSEISTILNQYINSLVTDPSQLESRFKYQIKRLDSLLFFVARNLGEELSQSEFKPAGLELSVHEKGDITPPTYTNADGTNIVVTGKIDRVDSYKKTSSQQEYVRVIDYKSGKQSFSPEDIISGINMQMLIYLNSVCQNSDNPDLSPAGILYKPSSVTAVNTRSSADVASQLDSSLKMTGLLISDENILQAMEKDLAGKFIPAEKTKSDTFTKSSKITTQVMLNSLLELTTKHIQVMGEQLTTGNITPHPYNNKSTSPCTYCNYSGFCRNNCEKNPPDFIATKTSSQHFAEDKSKTPAENSDQEVKTTKPRKLEK